MILVKCEDIKKRMKSTIRPPDLSEINFLKEIKIFYLKPSKYTIINRDYILQNL